MGCPTCGGSKSSKIAIPATVNYVLVNVETGEQVGEYGSRTGAVTSKKQFSFPTKVHPVKISSTEEKPKATTKTVKKVASTKKS